MATTAINQQLRGKYNEYVDELYTQSWPENVSSPLLMHVFDEYQNMDKKLMIVGQETRSWVGDINKKHTVDSLLEKYQEFDLGKRADYQDGKNQDI